MEPLNGFLGKWRGSKRIQRNCNGPFHFQNEAKSKTFVLKMNFIA